jgi:hypothetical protein
MRVQPQPRVRPDATGLANPTSRAPGTLAVVVVGHSQRTYAVRIPHGRRAPQRHEIRAVGLLIEHHPAQVSTGEFARALGRDHAAIRTADGLAALERDGLARRLDELSWPSRAALRGNELAPI